MSPANAGISPVRLGVGCATLHRCREEIVLPTDHQRMVLMSSSTLSSPDRTCCMIRSPHRLLVSTSHTGRGHERRGVAAALARTGCLDFTSSVCGGPTPAAARPYRRAGCTRMPINTRLALNFPIARCVGQAVPAGRADTIDAGQQHHDGPTVATRAATAAGADASPTPTTRRPRLLPTDFTPRLNANNLPKRRRRHPFSSTLANRAVTSPNSSATRSGHRGRDCPQTLSAPTKTMLKAINARRLGRRREDGQRGQHQRHAGRW